MTVLGSRVSMTWTCDILRQAGGSDSWGQPDASYVVDASYVPCRAWTASEAMTVEGDSELVIASRFIALPHGTDISERDRIGDVRFRGEVIWPGPHFIDEVTWFQDRLEAALRRTV